MAAIKSVDRRAGVKYGSFSPQRRGARALRHRPLHFLRYAIHPQHNRQEQQ
jgi:hypothetical protein